MRVSVWWKKRKGNGDGREVASGGECLYCVCSACGKITTTKILLETWTAKVTREETIEWTASEARSFLPFLRYFRFLISFSVCLSIPIFFRSLVHVLPFLAVYIFLFCFILS